MQFHLCSPWYNFSSKMFPLCRLPASLVWSAEVPRPRGGAAATSESGVMSSQQGTPVQSVMVSYPAVSNYQMRVWSLGDSACRAALVEYSLWVCPVSDGWPGGRGARVDG